jgi:hypothetical protein
LNYHDVRGLMSLSFGFSDAECRCADSTYFAPASVPAASSPPLTLCARPPLLHSLRGGFHLCCSRLITDLDTDSNGTLTLGEFAPVGFDIIVELFRDLSMELHDWLSRQNVRHAAEQYVFI